MTKRPLIPILLCFSAGILIGHELLAPLPAIILTLPLLLTVSLGALLFLKHSPRYACLLLGFFLCGMVMDLGRRPSSQLRSYAVHRKRVAIEGTVLGSVRMEKDIARFGLRAHMVGVGGTWVSVNEALRVSVYGHPVPLRPGDKIRFPARLRPFKNFNNPGRYDYESAMELKGFVCAASVSDGRRIAPMGPGFLPFPRGLLERLQRPVRQLMTSQLSPREGALYRALILGERQGIQGSLREPFNRTGLGHVLAVSGLHVGLVAWVAFWILRRMLSRSYRLALKTDIRKIAALLTCLPVLIYFCLAGSHVSTLRATIMVLAFMGSLILGREKEVWSTLALAGLIILGLDPHALFSISFQLSFAAVIGILWLAPPIYQRIRPTDAGNSGRGSGYARVTDYLIGLAVVSISATFFLLPIVSHYFHRISLIAVPANLTVVPVLGLWVIPSGLMAAVLIPLSPYAAGLVLEVGRWGLNLMMEMVRFWSGIPWASVWVVTPNLLEISMFYLFITLCFWFRKGSVAKMGLLLLSMLLVGDAAYWVHRVKFNKDLRVTFLDVGQGNSALVEFPGGKKMLIDGGGFRGGSFDVGQMVVASHLWHSKILRLHYLVLSHPQSDHMNGLRFIAKAFHPKEFWYSGDRVQTRSFQELMAIIRTRKITVLGPADLAKGRQINGVRVALLHPEGTPKSRARPATGTELNNNSLVLKVSHGGTSVLFPGDLETDGERRIISGAGAALRSHILLCPHHGSRTSSTRAFLRLVRPRICVISSGEGNFFGFPHAETLARLKEIGCRVIRIDQSGAVQCRIGAQQFEIGTFLQTGPNP
jgi:competence protein ComEC